MDSMYGYMDTSDHAYEIIEAVTDNKLIKLNYQFDSLMMEHAENLHAIELKVLTESGTDDDLTTLYLAEAEEVKEKGKGILAKIVDAIRAFIRKIKTTIFGKKPDSFPDKVEVDENPDDVVKEGNAIINAIKNFFTGDHKGLKIAGVGAAVAGTVAAVTLAGPKVSAAYKDLSDFVDAGDKALEESQGAAENADVSPEDMNLFKTLLNKLKTKVSKAGSMARALRSPEYKDHRDDEKIAKADEQSQQSNETISGNSQGIADANDKIKQLQAKKAELQKRVGNPDSRLSRIFNKNANAISRYRRISDDIKHKRSVSDKDMEFYRVNADKLGSLDSGTKAKIEQIDAAIKQLQSAISGAQKENDKARQKDLEAMKAKSDANARKATRGSSSSGKGSLDSALSRADGLLKESADYDSAKNLIYTANAEIDYFLNSIL